MSNWQKAVIATIGSQIIWGIAGPLVKIVLSSVPPFSLLFFRCLAVSVLLFPVFEFKLLPKAPKMTFADKKNVFLAGFVGVFLNIALYFVAQKMTTVIDAWVITSSGVIFILAYSYVFRHERLARKVYLGIGLAFVGTLIIIGDGLLSFGRGGLLGNLLMIGSAISAALSYFYIRDLVQKFSPMLIVYYSFLISLLFSLPLFLWEFVQNPIWLANLPPLSLLILSYLVVGSSIAAYYLSNFGLTRLTPSLSSTIGYLSTVIAIGLSIAFLGEKPTTYFIFGSIIIIFGLFLAETRHKKKTSEP